METMTQAVQSVQSVFQEYLTSPIAYWQAEVWPQTLDVVHQLEIPSWQVYHPALEACAGDVWKASQSSYSLAYLTFKPVAIVVWMVLQLAWQVGQFLFQILLEQGWIQLKKGAVQTKTGAIWLYKFQCSLSRMEVLGEVALVGLVVALYYTYRWMKRQTYWTRFVQWYTAKKERARKVTTKFVDRVARVSLILAMALPHMAFFGGYVAFKVLFPSLVKWLAHDTYTTALISIWYPLLMTLSWVHDVQRQRRSKSHSAATTTTELATPNSSNRRRNNHRNTKESPQSSPSDRRNAPPSYMKYSVTQQSRDRNTGGSGSSVRRRKTGPFSRTTPPCPETPVTTRATTPLRPMSPAMNLFINEPEAATRYWLRYWIAFALVQSVGVFGTMVPVFGSFVARHPFVLHVCSELKLLFFIWLFAMEKLIGAAIIEQEGAIMAKAMPLALIHEHVTPLLLELEAVVAESVSKELWMSLVHSKAQRVLDVLVMIKMISESRKEWLLHFLEEGRTLLLPSLSLVMPSFITQFGVAYVQFVVPSAKSARALGAQAFGSIKQPQPTNNEDMEVLYLQYWIVHCLVNGVLSYFSALLWWVPFSTHAIFLMWCHLSFPKSISQAYGVLETELVAFGLLPGESNVALHETRTARVFHALYSRLPSAADDEQGEGVFQDDGYDNDTLDGEATEPTLPGLDRTISVDSQRTTSVEVSIREPRLKAIQLSFEDDTINSSMQADETTVISNKGGRRRRQAKQRRIVDEEEEEEEVECLPTTKSSESSTTAHTHELSSSDSSAVALVEEPPSLRRSIRRPRN